MKTLIATLALAAALTAAALAIPKMDGPFPMYPNAHLDAQESSVPDAALASGIPIVIETADSVATVDAWYKTHLPSNCKRNAKAQGVQYACPRGSIQIYDHGGTQIAILPPMH